MIKIMAKPCMVRTHVIRYKYGDVFSPLFKKMINGETIECDYNGVHWMTVEKYGLTKTSFYFGNKQQVDVTNISQEQIDKISQKIKDEVKKLI